MSIIPSWNNIKRCRCKRILAPDYKGISCGRCIARAAINRQRVKDAAFKRYGGYKCNCCEMTVKEALQIDHINNDGAEHRRSTDCGTGDRFYRWLKRNNYPDQFQVLCASCNTAKQLNGGICPHKQKGDCDAETVRTTGS